MQAKVYWKVGMWPSTPRLRSLCQKKESSHIKALYWSLIHFAKSIRLDLCRLKLHLPENHVTASVSASNKANLSAVSFTLLHYNALAMFSFYPNLYIKVNFASVLDCYAELTLTDHRFNSWVYVWFIWIIFVAVHRQKWMTLTMDIIFIQ